MGVKGLFPFIKKYAPGALSNRKLTEYRGKIVVIDALLFIYRWHSVGVSRNIRGSTGVLCNHIQGMFFFTCAFIAAGITPVYVFDGKAPRAKEETLAERRRRPLRTKISGVIPGCQELLRAMGVQIVEAAGEAEAQCARMVSSGMAHAVATGDSDALVFGATRMMYDVDTKGTFTEIDLGKLLGELEISYLKFVDLCILLGTDYNKPIHGPKKALEVVRSGMTGNSDLKAEFIRPVITSLTGIKIAELQPVDREPLVYMLISVYGIDPKKIDNALGKTPTLTRPK